MATAATTRSRHRPHALRAHGLCALCWVGNGRDGMRVAARCSGPWLGGHRGASGAAPRGSPRRVGGRSTIAKLRFSVEWWYSSIGGSYYGRAHGCGHVFSCPWSGRVPQSVMINYTLYIYTSIHLYIYTSIHLYTYTSIHLCTIQYR